MADDNKCGHAGCGCELLGDPLVGEGKYCSKSCLEANSNDATDEPCACGCDGCGAMRI